jgi:hypothetical protein
MQQHRFKLSVAVFLCGLIGCAGQAASQATQAQASSSSHSSSSAQAVLVSPSGKAVVDGDTVELRGGEISVNGVSYGSAPPGTHVRYVKENGVGKIFVGDAERPPKAGK